MDAVAVSALKIFSVAVTTSMAVKIPELPRSDQTYIKHSPPLVLLVPKPIAVPSNSESPHERRYTLVVKLETSEGVRKEKLPSLKAGPRPLRERRLNQEATALT